jgi:hypothetical protein
MESSKVVCYVRFRPVFFFAAKHVQMFGYQYRSGSFPARAKNLLLAFLGTRHIVLQKRLIKCPKAPTRASVMAIWS